MEELTVGATSPWMGHTHTDIPTRMHENTRTSSHSPYGKLGCSRIGVRAKCLLKGVCSAQATIERGTAIEERTQEPSTLKIKTMTST